jgi:hypothetical protein
MKGVKLLLCLLGMVLAGYASAQAKKDFSAFKTASPRSILVVPVINISLNVDAPNYLLTTLTEPLTENGFYVFPVNTVKFVLEQEGFYEAEQVHRQPPEALARMFGADAVLYVTIKRWDLTSLILSARSTVQLEYRMVSKDGTEIWKTDAGSSLDESDIFTGLLESALVKDNITMRQKLIISKIHHDLFLGPPFSPDPDVFPDGPYLK